MEIKICSNEQEIKALAQCAKEIWNEYFITLISQAQIDYMVQQFQSEEALKKAIYKDHYTYFIGYEADRIIAYCGVQVQGNRLFLSKLYVKKQYRKQGIASKLLQKAIHFAKQQQCDAVYLTCNKYNENSLSIYRHKGFTTIDSVQTDIGEGFIMDDYILQLKLS